MKEFCCGDVVPGCTAKFRGSLDEVFAGIAAHARDDHGITEIPPSLLEQVQAKIRDVPSH